MAAMHKSRFFTLLQREFREYRNSLFWTPVITAVVLGVLMLGSVILVNRISVFGDVLLRTVIDNPGLNVTISMSDVGSDVPVTVIDIDREDESGTGGEPQEVELDYRLSVDGGEQQQGKTRIVLRDSADVALPEPPAPPVPPGGYEVIVEEQTSEEAWNFSREWRFNPESNKPDDEPGESISRDLDGRQLNPMLSVVHGILVLILLLTSINYLLGSLYDDRKDGSVLFWRSLPVSEWEIVLSKFVTAIVVAPLLYIAISLLLQLCYVLLMMVLVWRMGESPFDTVIANLDFVALMTDPISGWVLTALWIAPMYAYFLLASAAARRSPLLMALVPLLALAFGEAIFLGTEHVLNAMQRHTPHVSDSSAIGFYLFGPSWQGIDLLSMGAGLLFTAAALAGAVWLRKNRWEL